MNKCGFHIVEFYTPPLSGGDVPGSDYFFRFEKQMLPPEKQALSAPWRAALRYNAQPQRLPRQRVNPFPLTNREPP